MNTVFTEADWKAFRRNRDQMLTSLFERINAESAKILNSLDSSPDEIYRKLFAHVKTSDRIVSDCFDHWKRSNFMLFASNLMTENLIPDSLWEQLSEGTREKLKVLEACRNVS